MRTLIVGLLRLLSGIWGNMTRRIDSKYIDYFEILVLYFSMVLIKIPDPISKISFLLIPLSIYFIIKNKNIFNIEYKLKRVYYLFIAFLTFFTIYSINIKLSIKGLYEIIIGTTFLFIVILFLNKIKNLPSLNNTLLVFSILILIGNFFYPRNTYDGFYGYYVNPNNVAIQIFIVTTVSLLLFKKDCYKSIFLTLILLTVSFYLLYEANSRNVIIGILLGFFLVINIMYKSFISYLLQIFILTKK